MISFLVKDENGYFGPAFDIGRSGVITIVAIVLAVVLALYVLRSIGVYVLAKKQGVKCAFIAWIPFAWMYTACKIIGNARVFGNTFTRLALIFAIVFGVAEALILVCDLLIYYPLIVNVLFYGNEIVIVNDVEAYLKSSPVPMYEYSFYTGYGICHDGSFYRFSLQTELNIIKFLDVMSIVSLILQLASIFISVNVYIALFRKFWPQHFILASILSFFGLFAPFVFAIRNKNEVNYQDYVRSRYASRYYPYGNPYGNPYQNQGNQYGNPYGNPYNNPYGQGAPQQIRPENPFSEFAERGEVDPGDPFKDFSNDNNEPFSEYDKKDKD